MRHLCIFPGRFHPWHKGHKAVYDHLVTQFGAGNVYITCTDVVDSIRSPFTFEERKKMMLLTGVPTNKIVQVKQQYNDKDILANISGINPVDTILFFTISHKDMLDDTRFKNFTKKDGSPAYIQIKPNDSAQLQSMDKHAYLIDAPTTTFSVLGKSANSATQIRQLFSTLMPTDYEDFMIDLFGKYDVPVLSILKSKLQPLNEIIKKYIKLILEEEGAGKFDTQIKSKNMFAADAIIKAKKTEELGKKDSLSNAKKELSDIDDTIDTTDKSSDEISKERKAIEDKRDAVKEKIKTSIISAKSSSEAVKSAVNKKNAVKTGAVV